MNMPFPRISVSLPFMYREGAYRERRLIEPVREWVLGILLSSAAFIILAGYAGYNFYAQSRYTGEAGEIEASVVYKRAEVGRVLDMYRQKETTFKELRGDRSAVPIPEPLLEGNETAVEPDGVIPLAEEPVAE